MNKQSKLSSKENDEKRNNQHNEDMCAYAVRQNRLKIQKGQSKAASRRSTEQYIDQKKNNL